MAVQNQGMNMDKFEEYFRRADLDKDGKISGAEAVAFFQGSNLPKPVLAQVWMYADQRRTGFLDRAEFFNALRLVTVAQTKRDLTPDIVKAAIYGPAAARIPAPQINLPATPTPAPQFNSVVAASASQMNAAAPAGPQIPGYRGQGVQNPSMTQQYFPPQQTPSMRQPQGVPASTPSHLALGIPGSELTRQAGLVGPGGPNPNVSSDWLRGNSGGIPTGPGGLNASISSAISKPQVSTSVSSHPILDNSKELVVSGNGFTSNSVFGGDVFSATKSKQESQVNTYSTSKPSSSANLPVPSGSQNSIKSNPLDSLNALPMQPGRGYIQQAQPPVNQGHQIPGQGSSTLAPSGISVGPVHSNSDNPHILWPKMKPSDVQKYTKVFMEVDTDRDGRITGEQARSLFLSWRLPREVLKQVWDLSDQDSDSMLSLREFCFALYLMERFREGRPLPAALPSNVMYDETLLSMTGQPKVNHGNAAWGFHTGYGQQGTEGPRSGPPPGLRPPPHLTNSQVENAMQSNQEKSKVPTLEDPFGQFNNGSQKSVTSELQETTDAGKKVEETGNVILDSKEKLEFYRTRMQELVLYKSRCDNRLNEITERAYADKREAESLGKKYEEKYKQVAEIASKLTIEEARFRDVQGRKSELHQAIVKMEQGGSADGILQVRADRIQSDLEELLKALTERCKKHGLDVKSTAIVELPLGWQPGSQEEAAEWIEDWDKFEDEGFENEIKVDGKNVTVSSPPKSTSVHGENVFTDGSMTPETLPNANGKPDNFSSTRDHGPESEYSYTHSEDDMARSPPESPSKDFSDVHFDKNTEADAETLRSFDESTWGAAFDTNDDVDSIWGFNTKNSDTDKHNLFGSNEFAANSVSTESPTAESIFNKKSPFTFEDSVPSTPLSRFSNSPPRYNEGFSDRFDSSSRFDSFNMHDSGFSMQPEKFSRFDSISSNRDFGNSPERFTRFDSMNSNKDFGNSHIFSSADDPEPFGSSGPFKVSSDDQTPKKDSESWRAF